MDEISLAIVFQYRIMIAINAWIKKMGSMRSQERGKLAYSRMGNQITDPVITQLMVEALSKPDLLSLAAGFTDNHVLPVNQNLPLTEQAFKSLSI